jgi:tRNA-modifying protein YgfZ
LKQDISTGYASLRTGAGLVDRGYLGRLQLTGVDRRSYLQGLLTNDIESLSPGTGCYAALLTAQGRMITDMRVFELGDAILIDLPVGLAENVRAHLDRFVFSEDVQVQDMTAERAEIGLYGPTAASVVTQVLQAADVATLPLFGSVRATRDGRDTIVVRSDDAGVLGYDVFSAAGDERPLIQAFLEAGATAVDADAAEIVRIEAGRPRFGKDMDAETIPLEAGIEDRAISRTKGCYVGQEVIIRVLDRGHGRVARRLVGLSLDGEVASGAPIASGDRSIGRMTSAAYSPTLGRSIGLGYVHRDFTSPGTHVTVGGNTPGTVSALPFVAGHGGSSA